MPDIATAFGVLHGSLYPAATVLADWSSSYSDTLRVALVQERERCERVFEELTRAVDLPPGTNRRYFRLGRAIPCACVSAAGSRSAWPYPGRRRCTW